MVKANGSGTVTGRLAAARGAADLPDESSTPARLRACVGKLSRHLDKSIRGSGLTPGQYSALGVVLRDGPLRLSQLASIEGTSATVMSRLVSSLEVEGLVTRKPDSTDGRAQLLVITAAGRRLHRRVLGQRAETLVEGLGQLSDAEMGRIEEALPALEALVKYVYGR